MRASTTIAVLALGAVAGVGTGVGAHLTLPTSPVTRGVSIGDRRAPERGSLAEWLGARADDLRARRIYFSSGERRFETTLAEAGVELDIGATMALAAEVGHRGGPLRRLAEARAARRGEVDVPLVWRFDRDRARRLLEGWAGALHRLPIDARLDMATRTKIAEVAGQDLDVDATLEELEKAKHDDEETVALLTWRIPAKLTVAELTKVDVGRVLAEYHTDFATYGSGVGRTVNIRNAAAKIDGVVIPPGEVFSFNDIVGERSLDNGFTWAPEIMGDETTPGVGGGTCQVSTTLHVAALYGALEVVERQSHSRPSAYTKMGLDATVSFPEVDLKLRNNLPFPIMIHATVPEPDAQLTKIKHARVNVELLGGDPVATVSYRYGIGQVEDFTRRIYTKNHLRPGKRLRHQKGSRGYSITSWATINYLDGRVEERSWYSGYRPAPEVYWVAPGYDQAELPEMPTHAIGVEDRTKEAREARAAEAASVSM
ncbi:MAG: VanW family protein [Polyangiaceae bacterium]